METQKFKFPQHVYVRNSKPPVYECYSNRAKREATFQRYYWSPQMKQRPAEMAKAGYFYTGCNDSVFCFWCGEGVRSWLASDDPMLEHLRMSPDCQYIKTVLPPQNTDVESTPLRTENSPVANSVSSQRTPSLSGSTECVVCLEERYNIAFVPCGHLITCLECSFKVKNCPVCRLHIAGRLRVYKN